MTTDTAMPPTMFDLDETPAPRTGRTLHEIHAALDPDTLTGTPYCADTRYGSVVESAGRVVWVWHVCTATGVHGRHTCDRCDETWVHA